MLSTYMLVFAGKRKKSTTLITEDKVIVTLPNGRPFYVSYRIYTDRPIKKEEDITNVTIVTRQITKVEKLALLEGLAKFPRIIGKCAKMFMLHHKKAEEFKEDDKPDLNIGAWN